MTAERFAEIDLHFARFLLRLSGGGEEGDSLFLAAALASAATRKGHVCLDLAEWAGRKLDGRVAPAGSPGGDDAGEAPGEGGGIAAAGRGDGGVAADPAGVPGGDGLARSVPAGAVPPAWECPPLGAWRDRLLASPVVGKAGDFAPLVLDGFDRLYLHRYWKYETTLADALLARAEGELSAGGGDAADAEMLELLFPPPEDGSTDFQRVAAETVLSRPVTLVTGGPGTGKTATVARVLLLLLAGEGGRGLEVALAAPTGKAAARMKEALAKAVDPTAEEGGGKERQGVEKLLSAHPEIRERLPRDASTLHRLLGTVPGSTVFRHGPGNPLPHDVVVVDEASMIDLPLMAKLVSALSPEARLVLLGDRDQLASVEPGAVFGDLCRGGEGNRLARSVVTLSKSYRFAGGGGIGLLSTRVKEGEGKEAYRLLAEGKAEGVSLRPVPPEGPDPAALARAMVEGYRPYLEAKDPGAAFAAFDRFRVLCAFREGPFGVEAVNRKAERVLAKEGLLRPRGPWYPGRPVMVTRNDHRLKLYNGDVGILFPSSAAGGGGVSAFFPTGVGTFREVPVARLPEHESAWALTVHKSQGSEFDRVLLLLGGAIPGGAVSPVLTRELVYTGITRAKTGVEVWSARDVFEQAVARQVERRSGLAEALRR